MAMGEMMLEKNTPQTVYPANSNCLLSRIIIFIKSFK